MSASKRRVPLPGSERAALPSARAVGAADPRERIEVTVVLRPRTTGESVVAALSAQPPMARQYLSRAELAAARGAASYEHPGGTYRGRTGAIHVPEELAPIVQRC